MLNWPGEAELKTIILKNNNTLRSLHAILQDPLYALNQSVWHCSANRKNICPGNLGVDTALTAIHRENWCFLSLQL